MALDKVEYTEKQTIITAQNLNDIQDAIIALEETTERLAVGIIPATVE